MADQRIQLIIEALNKTDAAFGQIKRRMKDAQGDTASLNAESKKGEAGVGSLIARYVSLAAAAASVVKVAKDALIYLAQIETATLGIAAAFMTGGQYIDRTTGKALAGEAALRAAQAESAALVEELKYANLQTIATLDQLIVGYQQTLPVAIAKGFDKRQVKEFTVAMVQAAGAIGLPMDQLAEETRSLLTGAINPRNSRIATVLGLRSEDIAEYRGNATALFDFLIQKLDAYRTAGVAAQNTWAGLWSNAKDIALQYLGQGLTPLFEAVKYELQAITSEIVTLDGKTKTIRWNPAFVDGLKSMKDGVVAVIADVYRLGMLADKVGASLTRLWFGISFGAVRSGGEGIYRKNEEYRERYMRSEKALQDLAMREVGWKPVTADADKKMREAALAGRKLYEQTQVNVGNPDEGTQRLLRYYREIGGSSPAWVGKGTPQDAGDAEKAAKAAKKVEELARTMADIREGATGKGLEFASGIKKLTATDHEAKLIDIEDAYRKDMAAIEKYKTDMDKAVRELPEKIAKAPDDAAQTNAKQNILKAQAEVNAQVETMRKQAQEKRDIAVAQENAGSLASVRSFAAAQTQEYTQLTGNVRAGYKAEAEALRAKLVEELADVKKSAEEKAAITLLYNEKIRQAEVVKPAEYDRAAREAEINNRLASLDLIEAEGTAHRNTINERIRLTEELISLQRQSLAAMPKTGNEQAWNAQMDKIIAEQKKRADLVREQLMNSPIEAMKLGFKDLLNGWTDTGKQMYDIAQTTANSMQQAFSDIFFDAFEGKLKSVSDYITSFVNSVNRAIANYLADMAAAGLINMVGNAATFFFGNSNPGASYQIGAVGSSYTASEAAYINTGIWHGGGAPGDSPKSYNIVPTFAFAGAPRFHGGFAPDEYPAVLQRGEGVFTAGQMKALGLMAAGSGGDSKPNVEVNIINQSGTELSGKQRGAPKFDGRKWVLDIVVEGMERYAPLRTAVGNMRG